MDKISLPIKIIVWCIILVFIVLGIYCVGRMVKSKSGFEALYWFFIFIAVFAVPGFCMSKFFSHWTARKTAASVYWPGDNVELLPADCSGIRSNIAKGDYYKAIEELEVMMKEEPENDIAVALLSDIYIDHLQKYGEVITLLSDFLNRPERKDKDVPFVMKLVEVLLEINEDEKAQRLLNRELTLKYDEKEIESIQKRLEGIVRI